MLAKFLCPAKINTFLSVGPPDASGYHPIRTEFQTVSLGDEMTIEAGEPEVRFLGAEVPAENTVTKALRLLSELVPLPSLRITVEKRIPMASGLGGGSADAGGLLRWVRGQFPGVPVAEFAAIAASIGADVPFFLVGGRAFAEGYGERLRSLPSLPARWLVLAKPNVDCPTAEMYRALDAKPREFREWREGEIYNDFERVAPCQSLDLIERIQALGARAAGLSGSGSAVFGFFDSESEANRAAERLRAERVPWATATTTI